MERNPDILTYLSKNNKNRPKLVIGFSAETENIIQLKIKLNEKHCDLIVANDVSHKSYGFALTIMISIIDKNGKIKSIQKIKKFYHNTIAKIILEKLLINDKNIN